jgi:PTS system nitrogen regulatory IIA component
VGLKHAFHDYMRLTAHELSRRLGLPDSTLERWIRQGRIPVQHVGGECVFDERELRQWAASHRLRYADEAAPHRAQDLRDLVSLPDAARRGGLYRLPRVDGRDDALHALADRVPGFDEHERTALVDRLLEREGLSSTGIGRGIAVPHPRSPLKELVDDPLVVTGLLPEPVDFGSIDGQPVEVLFMVLAPSVKVHLALLSRLAFCLQDDAFLEVLHGAPSDDAFWSALDRAGRDLTGDRRT